MHPARVTIHDDGSGLDAGRVSDLVSERSGLACAARSAKLPGAGPLVFDGSPARMRPARGGEEPAAFDGFAVQAAARRLGPDGPGQLHAVLTGKLCCTYDPQDARYHARPVICANPAVISVPGALHGPARPRGYHLRAVAAGLAGLPPPGGRFLQEGDARLPSVAGSYVLQAAAYWATGEPFCGDARCPAFNARWQAEALRLAGRGLCGRCARAVRSGLN